MKNVSLLLLLLLCNLAFAQKTFIDQPFFETSAKADTLIMPDKIYLNILLDENDTKGKTSIENLERKMTGKLESLGVNIKSQLFINDISSNFKKYFLKQKDVLKIKSFKLLVYDANTAGQVIEALEEESISNVNLDHVEYSKFETLILELKALASKKAKNNATAMLKPLGHKPGAVLFMSDNNTSFITKLQGQIPGLTIRGVASLSANNHALPSVIEFEKMKIEAEVQVKFKIE